MQRRPGFKARHDFAQSQLSLTAYNDIDIWCAERLHGECRRMPPTEDYRKFWIFRFYRTRNLNRFLDHRSGNNRDPDTDRFVEPAENLLLKPRFNSGVDDLDAVALTLEHRRQRQEREWWCGFDTSI